MSVPVSFLDDDQLRRAFGQHGRASVERRLLLPRLLSDWLELFAALPESA